MSVKNLSLLAGCGIVTSALFGQQAEKQDVLAESTYKNITVLKGTKARDVIPAMEYMSASLHVQCNFCHVEGDFSKDGKEEKESARHMILMTKKINQDHFDGKSQITCMSCHNGRTHPNKVAAPSIFKSRHDKLEGVHKPEELISKYTAQLGSDKPLTLSGNVTMMGATFPAEVTTSGAMFKLSQGPVMAGFDGSMAWYKGGDKVTMIPLENADALLKMGLMRISKAEIEAIQSSAKVLGAEKLEGRTLHVIRGSKGEISHEAWIDPETGLIMRWNSFTRTPLGPLSDYVDFSDYKMVEGMLVPMKVTHIDPSGATTMLEFKEGKAAKIDSGMFSAPK